MERQRFGRKRERILWGIRENSKEILDALGNAETKKKGLGETKMKRGNLLIFKGASGDSRGKDGEGRIINKKHERFITKKKGLREMCREGGYKEVIGHSRGKEEEERIINKKHKRFITKKKGLRELEREGGYKGVSGHSRSKEGVEFIINKKHKNDL